jgi:hypothetical protein
MNLNMNLVRRVTKRDALLIYVYYAEKLQRAPQALQNVTCDQIAAELTRAQCLTARGNAFTAIVVRKAVQELERAGAAAREELEPGKFNLFLIDLDSNDPKRRRRDQFDFEMQKDVLSAEEKSPETDSEPCENPSERAERPSDRDENAHESSENPPEKRAVESNAQRRAAASASPEADPRARGTGVINKYKINKLINKTFQTFEKSEISESEPDAANAPSLTVDDALADFDFNAPKALSFRERLVRDVYEPGLHADLIDRAIYAVCRKLAAPAELSAAIRAAKEEKRLRETTNGYKGAKTLWQTLCLYVKSWFDAAGFAWTPTSFRREPAPKRINYAPVGL